MEDCGLPLGGGGGGDYYASPYLHTFRRAFEIRSHNLLEGANDGDTHVFGVEREDAVDLLHVLLLSQDHLVFSQLTEI